MKKTYACAVAFCLVLACFAGPAAAQSGRLTVDDFALDPAIDNVEVSPDGKHIAMLLLPGANQQPVLAIYKTENLGKDPVTVGSGQGRFESFFWGNNERLVVEIRYSFPRLSEITNRPGFAYWLASVDVTGKKMVYLPDRSSRGDRSTRGSGGMIGNFMQVQYTPIISRLRDDDQHILIQFNENPGRGEYFQDIYKINIATGRMSKVANGSPRRGGYITDRQGNLRFASEFDFDSFEAIFYMREGNGEIWQQIHRFGIKSHEAFDLIGDHLDDPDKLLVAANNGRDKIGLWSFNTKTRKIEDHIFSHPRVDVSDVLPSSKPGQEHKIAGYVYAEDIPKVEWVDAEEKALYDRVNAALPGTRNWITSRSKDDRFMTVYAEGPKESGAYYLLKNGTQLEFLGRKWPSLKPNLLGDVRMIRYKARRS